MLKHVLTAPKVVASQRLKLARDLIDLNNRSEIALYAGFKEMLNAGGVAYSLKALFQMKTQFQEKPRFISAIVRLRRKLKKDQ